MNRDRLLADAKACALQLAATDIVPHGPRDAIRVGGESTCARRLKLGVHLAWRAGRISDHDGAHRPQAGVHPRGRSDSIGATTLTEQQLLDLEREAFLSLCGERRTLERIAHTLKTGKPLEELASYMFDRGTGPASSRHTGRPGTLAVDASGARRTLARVSHAQLLALRRFRIGCDV